jgi:hypothetical protein
MKMALKDSDVGGIHRTGDVIGRSSRGDAREAEPTIKSGMRLELPQKTDPEMLRCTAEVRALAER